MHVEALLIVVDMVIRFVGVPHPTRSIVQVVVDIRVGWVTPINYDCVPPIRVQVVVEGDGPHHMDRLVLVLPCSDKMQLA